MEKLPVNQRIGVTESSEIAFNLEAFDNLYDGNIIITKRLTNKLIEKLVELKNEKRIDEVAYEIYGLTQEEIDYVESIMNQ